MTKKADSPFAVLDGIRDRLPPGNPSRAEQPSPSTVKGPARAVVRLERKGRRGKDVTVVELITNPARGRAGGGLKSDDLTRWCRELKQALGCGGTVEGDTIVLQGDLGARLPALLTARGVVRVTVSGG
jgi:translation initiation factor 1